MLLPRPSLQSQRGEDQQRLEWKELEGIVPEDAGQDRVHQGEWFQRETDVGMRLEKDETTRSRVESVCSQHETTL